MVAFKNIKLQAVEYSYRNVIGFKYEALLKKASITKYVKCFKIISKFF